VSVPGDRTARPELRAVRLRLIRDGAHVSEVIERGIRAAQTSVWIATANLKDVHVEAPLGTRARARGRYASLFEELKDMGTRGVEVRILCAGAPSRALGARIERTGTRGVELRRCPRVHQKLIAVDGSLLYLGSANLTGAGLGAKGDDVRNFEMGIVTDDEYLLDETQRAFDEVWTGRNCAGCRLRARCPRPLDVPRAPARPRARRL
jgi:phosphatidylserine/phosphatidylglycerophosphate/cardiolipin synthase-like enzyme